MGDREETRWVKNKRVCCFSFGKMFNLDVLKPIPPQWPKESIKSWDKPCQCTEVGRGIWKVPGKAEGSFSTKWVWARDFTLLKDELTLRTIKEMHWARTPPRHVWLLMCWLAMTAAETAGRRLYFWAVRRLFFFSFYKKFQSFRCKACEILVSWPGITPTPPALEAWSLNHQGSSYGGSFSLPLSYHLRQNLRHNWLGPHYRISALSGSIRKAKSILRQVRLSPSPAPCRLPCSTTPVPF